ncbi:MAG TPA: hypothetical protein VMD91_04315 [Candidatus Sulfotelmatobacter sp.]|nr:hypothetical protein [Candidatus Sulfotelmatobacter sp.]
MTFDLLRRSLLALSAGALALTVVPAAAGAQDAAPPGGKWRDCHGYVRHVSDTNIRVHCIDGVPADLSFLYAPNYRALFEDGKSEQTKALTPGTPVHIVFTQSLGVRKAVKIYIMNAHGHGMFGFGS